MALTIDATRFRVAENYTIFLRVVRLKRLKIADGELCYNQIAAPVAQRTERGSPKAEVVGSTPAWGACFSEKGDATWLNRFVNPVWHQVCYTPNED